MIDESANAEQPSSLPEIEENAKKKSNARTLITRLLFTIATLALWWWLADIDLNALGSAIRRLAPMALVLGVLLSLANLVVGALRWRVLMSAYGADRFPPFRSMVHLYFVGLFFNTFVPANIGGDVMRGHVTRRAFSGRSGAYLIVLIERIFGLAGLILLAGVLVTWVPIEGLDVPPWLGPLGLLAATGAALAPTIARRLSPWLPGPLGRLTANFPRLERPALMVVVMLLSVTTQSVVALTGHFCIQSVAPEVTVIQSLVLVPIALVSMYVPTIAGIGAREAAFVFFFGLLSVDEAAATAAGLGVGVIQLVSALFGGLVMLTLGLPQFEGDATDAIDGADSADIADSEDGADGPSTDEASDEEPSP